jgi:hypothetical protein
VLGNCWLWHHSCRLPSALSDERGCRISFDPAASEGSTLCRGQYRLSCTVIIFLFTIFILPSIHSLHLLSLGYIVQVVLCISKYKHSFILRLLGLPPTPIEMLFFSSPKNQPYKLLWLRNIDSSIFVSIAPPIFLFPIHFIVFEWSFFYFSSDTQKSTNIFPPKQVTTADKSYLFCCTITLVILRITFLILSSIRANIFLSLSGSYILQKP